MYWFTHFLVFIAGGTLGAALMAALQINRMENEHDVTWFGDDIRRRDDPDRDRDRLP